MKAQVDRAQLDLSYGQIISPVAGVVSKRTVNVANTSAKGRGFITLPDLGDLWVTANFKEKPVKKICAPNNRSQFPWMPSTKILMVMWKPCPDPPAP